MQKLCVFLVLLAAFFLFPTHEAIGQCSICTKTAQQLGEGPAKGLNTGIIYMAFAPFLIVGYIGWRWWKNNK